MNEDELEIAIPANRVAIYNPGRLNDAEIKASYIARQTLLEALLDDIDSTRRGGIPQHHLLVGQRGMGKTTLLKRLDVALREASRSTDFVPLTFPEEQWSLDRLSKLWLNCLDSLADTLEREATAQDTIDRIDDAVDVLAEEDDEQLLAEAAETMFLKLAKELGRRPVLLIDNLDLVFERLQSHEVNRLRAFLMRAGAPILVGACVSPPAATTDYSAAFYDHFKTHYLERLSAIEMRDVLLRLANRVGNKQLFKRLEGETPRLRALHALTGGNPRTTVILFQIFTKGFSQEAYQDLEALLDTMTPLYKARFEELSSQAQVVMSALATHWEPATSTQLCDITRLDNRHLGPQLDRLKKAGLVEEVIVDPADRVGPLPEGHSPKTRTGYQFAERFFNIWFLMRQATRRERRNLTFLTRFIECVHTPAERSAMARDLLGRRPLSREERVYELALEPAVAEYGLRYELHDHVQQEMVDASKMLQERIEELVDPAEIPAHRFAFADLKSELKSAAAGAKVDAEHFADAILGSPALLESREAIAKRPLSSDKAQELIKLAEEDYSLVERIGGPAAADWFRNLLRRGTVVAFSEASQVSDAFRRADTREKVLLCARFAEAEAKKQLDSDAWDTIRALVAPNAAGSSNDWVKWAHFLEFEFHNYAEAEAAFRKAIELQAGDANAWNRLGTLLHFKLKRYTDAEAAYRNAIKFAPRSAIPRSNLALLLHHRSERYVEAETLYREALELDAGRPWAWTAFGNLLRSPLHRLSEAEDAYRTALRLDPEYAYAWRSLAALLKEDLDRYAEAEDAFRKSLEFDPSSALAWRGLANLLFFDLQRYAEADAAYEKVLQLDATDGESWNNRGLLLGDCVGDAEKAVTALRQAIALEPDGLAARYNLVAVLRDQTPNRAEAQALALSLPKSETGTIGAALLLHDALFAAYDQNWDETRRQLDRALTLISDVPGIPPDTYPAWVRTTAVIIHLGYGSAFLDLLKQRGDHQRLRPWYEAIRARLRGDRRYLRNTPAEIHETAGALYDAIESRLRVLPESTRRWSPPTRTARYAATKNRRVKPPKSSGQPSPIENS